MIPIIAAVVGLFFFCVFPTVTYLYVEKRARPHWADVAGKKAPGVVRATAWVSLALGQLGLVWLVLPVVCGALVYALSRVGHGSSVGYTATIVLGVLALLQSLTSFGLIPFGIRVLARNSSVRTKGRAIGKVLGLVNVAALVAAAVTYGMSLTGGIIDKVIKIGLSYGVALPVAVFAAVALGLAAMMTAAAKASAGIDVKKR